MPLSHPWRHKRGPLEDEIRQAPQIAAASVASFLPVAPSLRYGLTSWAEMIRASNPRAMSLRAQWWALELASMATTQTASRPKRLAGGVR